MDLAHVPGRQPSVLEHAQRLARISVCFAKLSKLGIPLFNVGFDAGVLPT